MTLSKAIELFARELAVAGKSKLTITGYESDLHRLARIAETDNVTSFNADLVRRHFHVLADEGKARSTIHRKQAAINQFAKWGLRRRLWSENPMEEFERIRRPKHLPRPFTHAEVTRLMALEISPLQNVVRAVLLYTGLRVTPICGITLGDINFDPPSIRALVKGAKVQVVPMHRTLKDIVYNYVLAHLDLRGHTFLLNRRARPLRRRAIERMTAVWGQEAGVANCVPHRFRHTFGTGLLEAGVDIRVIKEALGHEDISSTMVYTQVMPAAIGTAIEKLDWPT